MWERHAKWHFIYNIEKFSGMYNAVKIELNCFEKGFENSVWVPLVT